MRNILRGFLPVLATVATLAPIAGAAHTGLGVVVLGAAVSLIAGRSPEGHSPWRLALVPVGALVIGTFALLFHAAHAFGDAFFVAAVAAATAARAFGPAAARLGRALILPLIGMLIAPIAPGTHPAGTLAWATLAVFIAEGYLLLAHRITDRLLAPIAPTDANPAGETGNATASDGRGAAGAQRRVHYRRALQSAVALTMAFAIGQTVFGEHWAWTVISAYTVGAVARSRGDALLKGVHRTVGALGGTLVATGLALVVGSHRALTVGLLLAVLAAGTALRARGYAWWAASVSAALALLYALLGVTGAEALTLLGERLLAVIVGALCAIGPAALLMPIRTGAVVRKRTGEALRSVRDAIPAGPRGVADQSVTAAEQSVAAVQEAAAPLLAVRRLYPWRARPRRELAWVDALEGVLPRLRALQADPGDSVTLGEVRLTLATVAGDLRAAAGRSPAALTEERGAAA